MSSSGLSYIQNISKIVLVVEDIPEVMFSLVAAVHELGHNAIPAVDGQEAWDLIVDGLCPDLIMLDLRMPRMNGIQFLNQTRSMSKLFDTPIILTSSDDLAADLVTALGLFGHAPKTTSRDSLRAMIKLALRKRPEA